MKTTLTTSLKRFTQSFAAFSTGQKAVVVIGALALLLGGFSVFRWVATPAYSPLFTSLAPADASAIVDQLEADGIAYKLTNGGNTILVPREQVYDTRIALSGEGLPSAAGTGYALLDGQDLSTSQFKEQTDFKRAMEGELSNTIESIEGVETAVVHLALPAKQVFADEQDPATASVLLKTRPGLTLEPQQVQAVVNLVSSSIDGLNPDNVTVADSTGTVLSAPAKSAAAILDGQNQQVSDFQEQMRGSVQEMLDTIVGPGNSSVQVTADLNFDKSRSESTRYFSDPDAEALSESTSLEEYTGSGGGLDGGVVGPDGQLDNITDVTGESGEYRKEVTTSDNAVNKTVEQVEAAPGQVDSLHVGVVLAEDALNGVDPDEVEELVSSALGIDVDRGDTVTVTAMPFDRTAAETAAKELAAAEAAEKKDAQMELIRNASVGGGIGLILAVIALRMRKSSKTRAAENSYLVEQLRRDAAERAAAQAVPAALVATDEADDDEATEMRNEISALVAKQPEDVAQMLRTWMVER